MRFRSQARVGGTSGRCAWMARTAAVNASISPSGKRPLREQFPEDLTHAIMIIAQHRHPHKQGLQRRTAEGLGLARQGQHYIRGRVDIPHVHAMAGDGNAHLQATLGNLLAHLLLIAPAAQILSADDEAGLKELSVERALEEVLQRLKAHSNSV